MKRFLWIGGGLLVLAALAMLALPAMVNVEQFRGAIRAELEKSLARKVEFSGMRLRLWPLSVALENLRIAEADEFSTGRPFLTAKEVDVHVDLLALLRRDIRIDDFGIEAPSLELVRDGERWNYATLGRASGSEPSSPVRLKLLEVASGTLAMGELGKPATRQVYEGIDLTLRDVAPGQPFGLDLSMKMGLAFRGQGNPLRGKLTAKQAPLALLARMPKFEGVLGGEADIDSKDSLIWARGAIAIEQSRFRGAPVTAPPLHAEFRLAYDGEPRIEELKLRLAQSPEIRIAGDWPRLKITSGPVAFADLARVATAFEVRLPAGVTAKGAVGVDLALDGARATGTIRATNLELSGASLKQPVRTPDLTLAVTPERIASQDFAAETAGAKLAARFTLDGYAGNSPVIDATLRSEPSGIPDLLRLARAYGVSGVDALGDARGIAALDLRVTGPVRNAAQLRFSGKGSLKDAALKLASVDRAEFDFAGDHIRLTAAHLRYDQIPLESVRTTIKLLGDGQYRLEPLNMAIFGGHHDGVVTVDMRAAAPRLRLQSKLDRVDADQLLSRFTGIKKIVYGAFSATGDLSLTLDADVARSLAGNLQIRLTDGKLAGLNLLDEVAGLGRFLKWVKHRDQFTSFLEIAGDLSLKDGLASSDELRLRLDKATVSSSGTLSLVDQVMKMRAVTTLGKDLSGEVGGSRVGGFMTTAFSNRAGELVIPAIVTGTFAKPKFAPDAEALARMRVQTFEPEKAKQQVEKIFDIFRKKK